MISSMNYSKTLQNKKISIAGLILKIRERGVIMENNENEKIETKEEVKEMTVQENYSISDFGELGRNTNTKTEVFTNIKDSKKIFNLENKVDELLNDCVDELIRVKEVLIKRYEKPLKDPVIDEETGEIIKDKEITMSCVLVDDNNKSYATGSKTFIIQLMRYLQMQERIGQKEETFDIKIIKKKVGQNGNKALSFELV